MPLINSSYKPNEHIQAVVDELVQRFSPQTIIIFSHKAGLSGDTSSFKLCVVANTTNKRKTEHEIYITIDSPVPFDILIYTPEEWKQLLKEEGSFASKIYESGVVLYE